MNEVNFNKEVSEAYARIKDYIYRTPLIKAYALSEILGAEVYLKLENMQLTSSFKIRGAFNKILSLSDEEKKRGVIAASSGNHGAGVAFACNQLNVEAKIFVPEGAISTKTEGIARFGAELVFSGDDVGVAENNAKDYAAKNNAVYVSPYNDLDIIFGQGTIAYEMLEQLSEIDEVFVAVGGGGLISGNSGYIKSVANNIKITGCLPKNSPVMYESIKAGKIVELENKPTLSDGTAGNLEPDSVTFNFCQQFVDDYSIVSEDEIIEAMKLFLFKEHMLVEGAAAVPLASMIKMRDKIQNKKVVIVVSGSNISHEFLGQVINH